MKYCKSCNQNVQPTKHFSIGWFLVNCLWIIGGGVYLLYFIFMKKKTCPICNGNNFEHSLEPNKLNTEDSIISDTIINKLQTSNDKMKAKNDIRIAYNTEQTRKRKDRELPWQIKADAKKAAKLNKTT